MIDVAVEPLDIGPWDDLTAGFHNLSLIQTAAYGQAKTATGPWRVERLHVIRNGATLGAAQVLIRRLPGGLPGGLAWINRGPLCRDNAFFDDVLTALHRHYVDDGGYYLRMAVPIAQPAESRPPEGFRETPATGWASARLALDGDVETLRKGLKQKWRNCLNKGERQELDVQIGASDALFHAFVDDYERFLVDAGFDATVDGPFLHALQSLLPKSRKMTAFLARHENSVVGSVLTVRYGDTVEYLAGASNDAGRKLNAGQVLLWQAVLAAKDAGARCFDVGGMDPVLTPKGIYRFKDGLGGVPYQFVNEWEALPSSGLGALSARLIRRKVNQTRGMG